MLQYYSNRVIPHLLSTFISSTSIGMHIANRMHVHLHYISDFVIDNAVLSSSDVISSACDVIRMYTSLIDQKYVLSYVIMIICTCTLCLCYSTRGMFLHNLMEAFSTGSLNTMLPHHQQSSSDNEFLPLNVLYTTYCL